LLPNIRFAFHALSLDESRTPFQTALWFKHNGTKKGSDEAPLNDSDGDDPGHWTTTLKQAWFSGVHSDVGDSMQDSRLSNISLGWMISELVTNDILALDQNYLLGEKASEQSPT
jgi:hypothetical protein